MLKETESIHKISDEYRIKFVSKSGIKLKHILEKRDPFQSRCDESNCKPCESATFKKHKQYACRKNRVCYEAKCRNCEIQGKDKIYQAHSVRLFVSQPH